MGYRATKIIFWSTTGLLSVIVLMYVGNSVFNNELFSKRFIGLGYPAYIIFPLAIAKVAGLIVLWSDKLKTLKEWAYAGLSFVFVLAIGAEATSQDGELFSSSLALILLFGSYISGKVLGTKSIVARVR